jgi:hypothetical protein
LQSKSSPLKRDGTREPYISADRARQETNIIPIVTKSGQEYTHTSDRGSIHFLLNAGTASFVECFRFPSSRERRNLSNFRNPKDEANNQDILQLFGGSSENGSIFSDSFEDDQTIDWRLFEEENLLRFLSSPFTDHQMQTDESNMFPPPIFMDPNFATPVPTTNLQIPGECEPPNTKSSLIVSTLFDKAVALNIPFTQQADFNQHLTYLFTPSKIEKLVGLYFEFWHPHCPILHQPSFNIETVPISLLIPVTLMGAMYSQIDQENNTAKLLLDLAELYVYSLDDLREESEIYQILRSMSGGSLEQSTMTSSLTFQILQGAYLMVCVQFWAGNIMARKRSVETRFGALVKVKLLIPSTDRSNRKL